MDEEFIERYAAKCADDGTVIIAYIENGVVRGAAELHPPDQSPTTACPRSRSAWRLACGGRASAASCSSELISEARWKGYRRLRDHDRRAE